MPKKKSFYDRKDKQTTSLICTPMLKMTTDTTQISCRFLTRLLKTNVT